MKTKSHSHCHGESSFHIVFSPKYRHDVFGKEEIKTFCEKCFDEVASKEYFDIRALKVMEDHVHLFVSIPPKFSVSETVQYFKGYSGRRGERFTGCIYCRAFPKGRPVPRQYNTPRTILPISG